MNPCLATRPEQSGARNDHTNNARGWILEQASLAILLPSRHGVDGHLIVALGDENGGVEHTSCVSNPSRRLPVRQSAAWIPSLWEHVVLEPVLSLHAVKPASALRIARSIGDPQEHNECAIEPNEIGVGQLADAVAYVGSRDGGDLARRLVDEGAHGRRCARPRLNIEVEATSIRLNPLARPLHPVHVSVVVSPKTSDQWPGARIAATSPGPRPREVRSLRCSGWRTSL